MATGNTSEDCEKCRICLSSFTKPRMLTCLHIFCSPCLEKLVEDKDENTKIKCPLCRSEIMLPVDGISGLDYPGFLQRESNDIKDQDGSSAVCQICDSSRVAFVKCIDCKEFLCKGCHQDHGKFNALKDHNLEYLRTPVMDCDRIATEQCIMHNKDLTLFFKPCNKSMCTECHETRHNYHDVISLFEAAKTERNILIAGIQGLKSKMLPIIESTLEEAKTERKNFSKHCSRIKQEIMVHATGLKEIFCKNVDLAMDLNFSKLEKLKKAEIKKIESYIDRLETDKLSFASMVTTSESILDSYTENQVVKMSPKLRFRMDNMNKYKGEKQEFYRVNYTSGVIREQDINKIVGSVTLVRNTTLEPIFRELPIPDLRLVKKFNKIDSFDTENSITSMVGGPDSNAWILHDDSVLLYSNSGSYTQQYGVYDSASQLLKTYDGTRYVWREDSATKLDDNSGEEFYKVPFENGTVGCFLSINNLVVYKEEDNTLYEVNAAGDIQRKVNNKHLSDNLDNAPINMIEAGDKNWIIVQEKHVITLRPDGTIQDISPKSFSRLPSLCSDRYGKVFLASHRKLKFRNSVCEILLRSENDFYLSEIHKFENADDYPNYMTVDGHGHLWCTGKDTKISIYSYM